MLCCNAHAETQLTYKPGPARSLSVSLSLPLYLSSSLSFYISFHLTTPHRLFLSFIPSPLQRSLSTYLLLSVSLTLSLTLSLSLSPMVLSCLLSLPFSLWFPAVSHPRPLSSSE